MRDEPASSLRFDVRIDGMSIGSFSSIDGLAAEYEVKTYEEGGQNSFVHQLPGRLKYTNIKLTRPVDKSSKELAAWFSRLRRGQGTKRQTATVVAFNDNREVVAECNLAGDYPDPYTGPSFSTDSAKVATETLELAHTGFLS
jgi:phage tail-like protein